MEEVLKKQSKLCKISFSFCALSPLCFSNFTLHFGLWWFSSPLFLFFFFPPYPFPFYNFFPLLFSYKLKQRWLVNF